MAALDASLVPGFAPCRDDQDCALPVDVESAGITDCRIVQRRRPARNFFQSIQQAHMCILARKRGEFLRAAETRPALRVRALDRGTKQQGQDELHAADHAFTTDASMFIGQAGAGMD
jgi:hypothetical protein